MIIPKNKYKIALVGYTLNKGGLEKVISNLSVYFDSKNIEVHNIILNGDVNYQYGGILKTFENLNFVVKYWEFYQYLRKNKFDFILDFRYRLNPFSEILISKFIYNTPVIYSVQSSKIDTYFPSNKLITKYIFNTNHAVVCGSNGIQNSLKEKHNLSNVTTIYNPISVEDIISKTQDAIPLDFEYIIAAGRFDFQNIKQFDMLIETYLKSKLATENIHLILIGDGENKKNIQEKYKHIENVHFLGFKENPYAYMSKAKYYVLCSKYEGFGMVLAEALASGIPVVSFDCKTGPNEIIINEWNGLLVKDQDFDDLKSAMERMINNKELFSNCKKNAISSVIKFDIETIGKEWLQLMKFDIF